MINQTDSDTIKIMRTVLCFLIVFLHMGTTGLVYQEHHASHAFTDTVSFITLFTRIAVPLFFIISGYLFFVNYKNTSDCYIKKIKSRMRRLLCPIFFFYIPISATLFYSATKSQYGKSVFRPAQAHNRLWLDGFPECIYRLLHRRNYICRTILVPKKFVCHISVRSLHLLAIQIHALLLLMGLRYPMVAAISITDRHLPHQYRLFS